MESKRAHVLRIHLGLFFAEAICLSAFALELSRALRGNTLSWAYVVEWPVLGTYAVYMWRKLLNDERAALPSRQSTTTPRNAEEEDDDPRLSAWNDYLQQVHAAEDKSQKKT